MKLFRFTVGAVEAYGVAKDAEDAYNRRAEVDHTFHFTPVVIQEVVIPGYEIIVKPAGETDFSTMSRDELKEWLKQRDITYFNGAKIEKLRELAMNA